MNILSSYACYVSTTFFILAVAIILRADAISYEGIYSSYVIRSEYLFDLSDDSPARNNLGFETYHVVGAMNTVAVVGGPILLLGYDLVYNRDNIMHRTVYFVPIQKAYNFTEQCNISSITEECIAAPAARLVNYEGYDPITQEYGHSKGLPTDITLGGDLDVVIVPDIELGAYYLLVIDYIGKNLKQCHNDISLSSSHVYHSKEEMNKYVVTIISNEQVETGNEKVSIRVNSGDGSNTIGKRGWSVNESIMALICALLFILLIIQTIRYTNIIRICDRKKVNNKT